jgi:hypothetical protein
LGPLRFILDSHQFRTGVIAGLLAVGAVGLCVLFAKRRPLALAGLAFAAASYVALSRSGAVARDQHVPGALLAGVALAYLLTELARAVRPVPWLIAVAGAPGAIVTAGALVGVPAWIRVAVAAFGAIGGACIGAFEGRHSYSGLGPIMWLITVGAVYSTVPDTEAARAVLGVALAVAVLGWPGSYARLGTGGAAASACMLGWVIGQGGVGRPGSVIGAVGTLGLFALEPIVGRLRATARSFDSARPVDVARVFGVHLLCALAAARWAGLAHGADTAALRLLVIVPFALLLTRWIDAGPAPRVRGTPPEPRRPAHRRQ